MTSENRYSPTCSVVVCTRDRPASLDQCLAALSRLDYTAYDVVVVDNAPSDQRSRDVALRWGARYLTEPAHGLSRARNYGARACRTEIIAYIDDDALPEPEWLSVLGRDFEDPQVMAVTGAILPISLVQATTRTVARCDPSRAERAQRRVVDRETPGWFEIANFGGLGDGSNMAFRRTVFDVWPGFDEHLGRGTVLSGGEEHYAFFRLIERGYRVVYNPEAVVRHPYPNTVQEFRNRHLNVLATASAYIIRLAVEHPSCWKALARYVFECLRGTSRPWMRRAEKVGIGIVPRWLSLLAMSRGPWIYVRSKMSGEGSRRVARNLDEKLGSHRATERGIIRSDSPD